MNLVDKIIRPACLIYSFCAGIYLMVKTYRDPLQGTIWEDPSRRFWFALGAYFTTLSIILGWMFVSRMDR